MATKQGSTLNPSMKIFLSVFLYIGGLVGLVLAVVNASQKPASTTLAIIYGVAGVVLLAGGFMFTRKRRY